MDTKCFTLNQLIDISLNTPDVGTVNFKILRTVLKIIVKELDIHDVCARVPVKDLQTPADVMGRDIRKKKRDKKKSLPPIQTQRSPPEKSHHESEGYSTSDVDAPPLSEASNTKVSVAVESVSDEHVDFLYNEDAEEEEQQEMEEEEIGSVKNDNLSNVSPREEESLGSEHASAEEKSLSTAKVSEKSESNAASSYAGSEEVEPPIQKNSADFPNTAVNLFARSRESISLEHSFIEERSNEGTSGSDSFYIETSAKPKQKESFDIIGVSSDTRCTGNKWLVSNMWKTMNFARRIDAIETGVDKIISVLNIHVQNMNRQRKDFERKKRADIEISETIEKNIDNLIESVNDINSRMDLFITKDDHVEFKRNQERKFYEGSRQHESLVESLGKLQEMFDSDKKISELLEAMDVFDERIKYLEENAGMIFQEPSIEDEVVEERRRTMPSNFQADLTNFHSMYDEFVERIRPLMERFEKQLDTENDSGEAASLTEQLMNVRVNVKQLSTDNNKLRDQLESLQFDIKKQNETIDMLVDISEKGFHPEDKEDFYEMQKKLRIMEKEFDQLEILDELQNAIVSLRTIKANKAEIEIALQKKAEIKDVICKVNKNEYEAMIKDMSNGLQEMMGKIVIQEQSLQKAVQNLTNELDNKVDRLEIEGSSETLHARLKALAAKVKQLQCIVEYDAPIAAGTKVAVAKCISCDRPMRKLQEASVKSFPPNLLSRSKTCLEAPQIISINQKHYIPSSECTHVGRTTGGTHTITNPELHATTFPKITVFNKSEWETIPLKGTDNVLYRGQIEKLPPVSRKIGMKNLTMDDK